MKTYLLIYFFLSVTKKGRHAHIPFKSIFNILLFCDFECNVQVLTTFDISKKTRHKDNTLYQD